MYVVPILGARQVRANKFIAIASVRLSPKTAYARKLLLDNHADNIQNKAASYDGSHLAVADKT